MDLEDQWKILQLIEKYGAENLLVLLGCPDAESSQIQAETVTRGDPSKVGPLTDLQQSLSVYHVIELAVASAMPQELYDKHILKYCQKLDSYSIRQRMDSVRGGSEC